MGLKMDAAEMNAFLGRVFLEVASDFNVDHVDEAGVTLRLLVQERHLRPGGTVSGPAMFGLADVTAYMVTLAHIGPRALAVTTNCSIDFMRQRIKPRGFHRQRRKLHFIKTFHHIAENSANSATARARFLLQLFFVIGLKFRSHNDDIQVVIIIHSCHTILNAKHALVSQKTKPQIFWIIPDRHRRHDFLRIQINGQRTFFYNRRRHRLPVLVKAVDSTR